MLRSSAGWLRSRVYDLWIGLKPSRFGILTVLLLAVLLVEPWTQQGRDVLREYSSIEWSWSDFWRRFWLYSAVLILSILTWGFCRLASTLRYAGEEDELRRYREEFPRSPLKQGVAVANKDAAIRVRNIYRAREWAPRVLAILIPLVLALAFLLVTGGSGWRDALIAVVLAALVAAAIIPRWNVQTRLANRLDKAGRPQLSSMLKVTEVDDPTSTWSELSVLAVLGLIVIGILVTVSVILAALIPLEFGQAFGPVPVVTLVLTVILAIGSLLAMGARLSNFPLFSIGALIIALMSQFGSHSMRFVDDADNAIARRLRPAELVEAYAKKIQGSGPQPVFLVATAGGGSRAAFWTATVLGELNRQIPGFNDRLLVISGVSGGSLGALFYRAATLASPDCPEKALAIAQQAASGDFLSPLLSSMFTRDLIPCLPEWLSSKFPRNFIPNLPDRAEVTERAWSASFAKACEEKLDKPCPVDLEQAFLKLWPEAQRWPALILNGTVVETGARAVASSIKLYCEGDDLTCGLIDVADVVAYKNLDLRASSAANVSARFPLLGPSANILINTEGAERSVVDGGYFDNFGALTLMQVMDEMEDRFGGNIVPIVIQITSDPDLDLPSHGWRGRFDPRGSAPSGHQVIMPLRTFFGLRESHGKQAMLRLRAWAERKGTYIHFGQCGNTFPEKRAPLAWVLSRKSREHLLAIATAEGPACNTKGNIQRIAACMHDPQSPACKMSAP